MMPARARRVAVAVVALAIAVACSASAPVTAPATGTTGAPGTTATTGATAVEPATTGARPDSRAVLARLAIDDGAPAGGYLRELFPTWLDIDGDGCDARQQALRATSNPPATVGAGCAVVSGTWYSDYDGQTFTDPRGLDVDHVVPLADAWRSGASGWTTDQRARLANDPANLWPVSASTNRSKSDRSPDQWRPPRHEVWCTYATRWLGVKVTYGLTATTPERDALGQMLDTCTDPPAPTTSPSPPVATTAGPSTTAPYFASCAAARAAGATPLRRGEPGYRDGLDGDQDGIACE